MDETTVFDEALTFLKALADENRLRIVGLLAEREHSVEDLATRLNLQPSTVSHHLYRLSEAGLVSVRTESYYRYYTLDRDALQRMAQRLFSEATLPAISAGVDSYESKVIANFTGDDGRLKSIPAQYKKRMVVLRHIREAFTPGRRYTEREVNDIIKRFHDDTAGIRRDLVDTRLMQREGGGGMYWYEPEEA
ncbi:MAG: metalloregulator ArsR/SmtB family transcription factor [Anaerolineae bacterium]|nr:metalloregulator ArsR/SmtB family transcription factor [Anaerolineae bacterium]